MRFAVIDLGTNTFNLLIAESDIDNSFIKIFDTKVAVKLGEGAINAGYIADVPFQRGINALKQFQQYLLDYDVEQTYVFATSAIRTASNGAEFIAHAKKVDQASAKNRFGLLRRYYEAQTDRFVSDYATMNSDEDMAETFVEFVRTDKPLGNTLRERKILAFYQNAAFVKERKTIRTNLQSLGAL